MPGESKSHEEGARLGEIVGGRYRLLRVLGSGGMGEVYEAEHSVVGKRVAFKCLWPKLASDVEHVQRFEREARVASLVQSPHVVDVIDAGVLDDGAPFLVMELLDGTTLGRELATAGLLAADVAIDIAKQIAAGLGAAHAVGIVHRDLKPDNIFLVHRGQSRLVKIVDFGISKFQREDVFPELTRTGTMIGTPTYMSPEQAEGLQDIDARADVWSLGVILFRMLTGELPFTADNYARLLVKVVSDDPAPRMRSKRADVPAHLDAAVARCLEKSRSDRFASMGELVAALSPGDSVPTMVSASAIPTRPSHPARTEPPDFEDSSVRRSTTQREEAPTVAAPVAIPPAPAAPRPIVAPPAPAAPNLPFDEVVLHEPKGQRRLPARMFFELPLSERIRHVIARTVVFLKEGVEVDRQDALARMRELRAG